MQVSLLTHIVLYLTRKKGTALMISFIVSLVVGIVITSLGYWLPPSLARLPPLAEQKINNIAQIHRVLPPEGGRKFSEIGSVTVKMGEADDYGRVFVNNYLIMNGESKTLFTDDQLKLRTGLDAINKDAIDRANPAFGEHEVKQYLRKGLNYIVFELENSLQGTCAVAIDIKINGIRLQGFPIYIPNQFDVEEVAVNPSLLAFLRSYVPVTVTADALCARRIVELELE
jgi:hypothetical protein